ncbi:MAG: hypothetical protein JNJ59_20305 [Deltaproteobacteria bacterium]|nr:hypothetical protein [Deltaproteobacteria bacterium]
MSGAAVRMARVVAGAAGVVGAALVAVCGLAGFGGLGCYQSVTLGYANQLSQSPGHGFEAQYNIAVGETGHDDWVAGLLKVSMAGGAWGLRGADGIGVMGVLPAGGVDVFFRPALDVFVIGVEEGKAGREDKTWVGIGAELEAGILARGDDVGVELGVRVGGDLSYTGQGGGGFCGVFVGLSWESTWDLDFVTR